MIIGMVPPFRDRREAGRALAELLDPYRAEAPIVLALPRGGVPVGYEIARALDAPLDVIVVRKLGVPFHAELGMGAIGEDDVRVLDPSTIRAARVTSEDIAAVEVRERVELTRRVERFRDGRPMTPIEGRTVIVVDDGIATGGTARAALQVARLHGADRVVLAAPVAAAESLLDLAAAADELVVVSTPSPFVAIGQWYENFDQTSDTEVRALLVDRSAR
jgi:predicted phosphoribosyltransferase